MLINTVGTYVTRPDITIAVTMDSVRYHWYWGARLRKGATANLIIRLTNAAGGDVLVAWGVQSATSVGWTGPRSGALSSTLAMGAVQLQYDLILWRNSSSAMSRAIFQ